MYNEVGFSRLDIPIEIKGVHCSKKIFEVYWPTLRYKVKLVKFSSKKEYFMFTLILIMKTCIIFWSMNIKLNKKYPEFVEIELFPCFQEKEITFLAKYIGKDTKDCNAFKLLSSEEIVVKKQIISV